MRQSYHYRYTSQQRIASRTQKPRRTGKFFLTIVILLVFATGAWFTWSNLDKVTSFAKSVRGHSTTINQHDLQTRIAPLIPKDWTLGLYVYDINSSSSFGYNPDQSFTAASLTKLPALITVFQAVQDGKLNMSDEIPFRADEIQDYGTSILQYKGPDTTYTVQQLVWYMANRSDNSSFQIFLDKFGDTNIDKSIQQWGFAKTSIIGDTTTPRDMVGMFNDIYSRQLVSNKSLNQQMQDLLVKTNEESRIPAGVPPTVRVVHKTGNAIGGLQDAGIVYLENRPYIIAIMSDGVSDEKAATQAEAAISQAVYDYLADLN